MSSFEIIGGTSLKGELIPQGAKNEALQILSATLLTAQKVTISNIPAILDVIKLIELLAKIGVEVVKISESEYTFQANNINIDYLKSKSFAKCHIGYCY